MSEEIVSHMFLLGLNIEQNISENSDNGCDLVEMLSNMKRNSIDDSTNERRKTVANFEKLWSLLPKYVENCSLEMFILIYESCQSKISPDESLFVGKKIKNELSEYLAVLKKAFMKNRKFENVEQIVLRREPKFMIVHTFGSKS